MKKTLFVLFVIFIPFLIQAQTVSEKLICKLDNLSEVDIYSLKYDEKTGSYVYVCYDSTKKLTNSIISNKGNSGDYDYINSYNAVFDSDGNYYIITEIKTSDSTYRNIFLKNGKELFTYDFINPDITEKNGILYLICNEKEKSFITTYDISTGNIFKGKVYDELIPCVFSKSQYEGEPVGSLGFTGDDKVFYVAKLNNESFFVIGDEEQKHYADIDAYSVLQDKSGKFAFVAKDTGNFIYSTDGYVVHGDKKYKSFNSIYNLILDSNDNVIYIAGDSSSSNFPQRIMNGDKSISKTYNGGIYNLGFTPEGKYYFIASEKRKNSDVYDYFVVFNGKEQKVYQSIFNLKVLPGDELLYVAQQSEDKYVVVSGTEEIHIDKKLSVLSAELMKNKNLAYISVEYGNYDKKINDKYYLHLIDRKLDAFDKKLGPYEGMQMLDYKTYGYILSDEKGNYAYLINNIKNFTDYYYVLYTNSSKSKEFDNISDVNLYNGKALYIASRITDKEKYTYKYIIYYDNKPITSEYESINDYKFDEKTGVATYEITKDKSIYKVEIKF